MKNLELTTAQEQCLRNQVISSDQPGTVLRDFDALLDYVGPEGVEAQGKYNLLPMKLIGELDRRLSRPLHLDLKRPQIRSHPYLQGLNLLLRASGLTRIDGTGARARLVVDPEMMVQWEQLNPTEQYFNLLEAWLRFGRAEMVGENERNLGGLLPMCLQAWQPLPEKGRRFDLKKPQHIYISGICRELYLLALMDLFGLVEVEHPPRPVSPWAPAAVRHVPFGDAIFTLLANRLDLIWGEALEPRTQERTRTRRTRTRRESELPQFGAWQPLFQPYFPSWQENLVLPEREPREGTFVFRVSLGKIWRLIAMPADATLDDLVDVILRSVKFDNDHLHEFTYRNRLGAKVSVHHPEMDEPPYTDEVLIGTLPLEPGQTMELTYDFGDNWHFTVKLDRIEPPAAKLKAPRILESHGKAPEQYGGLGRVTRSEPCGPTEPDYRPGRHWPERINTDRCRLGGRAVRSSFRFHEAMKGWIRDGRETKNKV